ncbi:MAG: hypothetical protein ABSC22_04950 [Roseiarcus sp.]|jgi:hypothetical protein
MTAHLFFGPNAPGSREVAARADAAAERARADDPANAARERRNDAMRAYPDRARKLAARGLPVAAPQGFEEAFELRAHLQRIRADEVERRIADALRPAERGTTAAARLARADAAIAEMRRPRNLAGAPPRPAGDRRAPPSPRSEARAEIARMRALLANGLARTRAEAARIVAAETYDARGPRACYG